MHAPRTTLWPITELVPTKHAILRGYLEWWLPTMIQQHQRVRIFDGFAGPGEYQGGEEGSPQVIINTLQSQLTDLQQWRHATFFFIDESRRRCQHLRRLLDRQARSARLRYFVLSGNFMKKMKEQIDDEERLGRLVPPTFAFLDPFGFSDIPLSIIARIMQHPHNEVLLTFMYEETNRFFTHPDKRIQRHLTELFGTEQWRDIDLTGDPGNREWQLCNLYRSQLQTCCNTKYVRMFRMKNRKNITDYFLVFVTHKRESLEKMKEIFWESDPRDGETFFALENHNQLRLIPPEPNYQLLADNLCYHFKGMTACIDEIDEFVLAETSFCKKDGRHILKHLEQQARISVTSSDHHRQSGPYGETDIIHFK